MKSPKERMSGDMDGFASLRSGMEDAGCTESSIARAEALYSSGAWEELIYCLRRCRCEQLEALHEKQKQLDRLDLLIRKCKGENAL